MKVDLLDFDYTHLFALESSKEQFFKNREEWFKGSENGYSKTLVVDGRVIGCGGVSKFWDGVGEAWLLVSDKLPEYKWLSVKVMRIMFDRAMIDFNRIQAAVLASDPVAIRFIEFMGFENEGLMRRYGFQGADFYRYARVK